MEPKNENEQPTTMGGRRHKGSKRHGNASLRAWVTFVKKVQKEEGVSYREAMMRAKKRKDKGEKWRGGAGEGESVSDVSMNAAPEVVKEEVEVVGGRRRRRRTHKRRGSKKRHTRRHRRSRRHH
jgi:hypothetical protein